MPIGVPRELLGAAWGGQGCPPYDLPVVAEWGGACRWVVMLYKIAKVGYTAALLLGLAACRSYVACESGLIAKESR